MFPYKYISTLTVTKQIILQQCNAIEEDLIFGKKVEESKDIQGKESDDIMVISESISVLRGSGFFF